MTTYSAILPNGQSVNRVTTQNIQFVVYAIFTDLRDAEPVDHFTDFGWHESLTSVEASLAKLQKYLGKVWGNNYIVRAFGYISTQERSAWSQAAPAVKLDKAQALVMLEGGSPLTVQVGIRYDRYYDIEGHKLNGNIFNALEKRLVEVARHYTSGTLRSITYRLK